MTRLLIGDTLLNQFRVENFIAAGGMATIYRVWDLQRGVPLAMKVLHPELAHDPAFMARFQREARALQSLSHPHIVPFYGMYKAQDITFLLERYVDGPSLDEILRRRAGAPMSLREALVYFKGLYTSLGYAHAQGIIHCDVKPGNVLIDQGGHVYLTDFGIARYTEATGATSAIGTPIYMAPEQIRGERVSPETDVYSLGVLMYELLTGQRPFRPDGDFPPEVGASQADKLRYAHLYLDPPDPRIYNPTLPESLARVILNSLSKDPQDRYPNMQAMAEAVFSSVGTRYEALPDRVRWPDDAPFEEGAFYGVNGADQEGWERGVRQYPARPRISPRLLIALGSTLLVILCLLAGTQLARGVGFGGFTNNPQQGTPTGSQPAGVVPTSEGALPTDLPTQAPTDSPTADPSATVALTPSATPQGQIGSFTPPGELAVVTRQGGRDRLFRLDAASGEATILPEEPGANWSWAPQWSPDGSRLVFFSRYNGRSHVMVMDLEELEPVQLPAGEGYESVSSPSWLPNGQQVGFWGVKQNANWLVIADATTGELVEETKLSRYRNLFAWNWQNGLLAFIQVTNNRNEIVISGSPLTSDIAVVTGAEDYAPAWSRDGQWLAFQSDSGRSPGMNEIWIVGADGSNLRRVTFSPDNTWSRAPTWSPDGHYIAYVSDRAGSIGADFGELFVVDVETSEVVQVTSSGGSVYDWRPAWRP